MLLICKYCAVFYKGLEYPRILGSGRGSVTNLPLDIEEWLYIGIAV